MLDENLSRRLQSDQPKDNDESGGFATMGVSYFTILGGLVGSLYFLLLVKDMERHLQ